MSDEIVLRIKWWWNDRHGTRTLKACGWNETLGFSCLQVWLFCRYRSFDSLVRCDSPRSLLCAVLRSWLALPFLSITNFAISATLRQFRISCLTCPCLIFPCNTYVLGGTFVGGDTYNPKLILNIIDAPCHSSRGVCVYVPSERTADISPAATPFTS